MANSTFFISCPEDCRFHDGVIYGTDTYSANSPLCKAGTHSGALKKTTAG